MITAGTPILGNLYEDLVGVGNGKASKSVNKKFWEIQYHEDILWGYELLGRGLAMVSYC